MARFRAALELQPDNAAAHFGLGLALRIQGNQPEGTKHLRQAVRLDPRFRQPVTRMGISLSP